ncbi:hypothetical protein [Salinispora arenicola]|uniref:hypothetical protein n=1 Tax=Salinispora arenicola TaxID=168697 RepID=UPI0016AD6AC0|nr:hypothetical protein [Salinispora arenicola]NIL62663.1 hypothetical protein [Salinispora arenicola]
MTAHPAWCQPNTCTTSGPDTTHRHLIGTIAGLDVLIQRTDTTRDDGSHLYGHTGVHIVSEGRNRLTEHLDTLHALLTAAELFADQVEGVR